MQQIENQAKQVLLELISDNVLGCRALLSVCQIHFTREVDSAAVTLGSHPRLRINPDFLADKAPSPEDMRVVILHEFLHVLLRHTQQFKRMTPLMNFVLDIQVNSFLGRQFPHASLGLLYRLYGDAIGPYRLLAPPNDDSRARLEHELADMHRSIYGEHLKYTWSDLFELFKRPMSQMPEEWKPLFLGHHADQIPDDERPTPAQLTRMEVCTEDFLHASYKGYLIMQHGQRTQPTAPSIDRAFNSLNGLLKRKSATQEERNMVLPVLHPGDRRAGLKAVWSPILPMSAHPSPGKRHVIRVYLDVSGSMSNELPEIIGILHRYRDRIESPLRVFSTKVGTASWSPTGLTFNTSGGTDLKCVIEDLQANPAAGALIVTDGCFSVVEGPMPCPLHAVLSRSNSPSALRTMNVPITFLQQ